MKFAQGTYTSKFLNGPGPGSSLYKNNVGIINQNSAKKLPPYQMKLQDKIMKSNLLIDPNSTFVNFDRSRSGIGGAIAATDKGLSSYTTLSVYRYKAVIKKQRRQDNTGHRQFQKYYNRHNRFDKKGNRMMNGVSVAHAKR